MQGILKNLKNIYFGINQNHKRIFTFSDIDILETEEYNKTKVNTINPMSKSK